MRNSEKLRNLLGQDELLMVPGCYDGITANLIKKTGFQAAYISGAGISFSLLGRPDLNMVSYFELKQKIDVLCPLLEMPVIVDIDAGFGGPLNPIGGKRSKWSEKRGSNTVEKFVEEMKASGVDKAVLVHSSTTYGYDCSYVADCVARYPGILWGVGSIDFLADNAVDKLNYWAFERKLSAIRLFTHGSTQEKQVEFDDPKSFPAWEWCQKNRFPVIMQCRSDGFGMLHNILNRFPDLLIALDHAGLPFGSLEDGYPYKELAPVLEFAKYPGMYLKVTSSLLRKYASVGKSTPQDFIRAVIDGFGVERIMWGSNFPSFGETLQECVDVILEACSELSNEEQEACLGLNAQKFYSLT